MIHEVLPLPYYPQKNQLVYSLLKQWHTSSE